MKKNIILCADGTGNKGGYTPDSNVYKIYNAIDLNNENTKQITFYDNGVGTQTNKYIRGLSAALGFGFKKNVCDLYEYLARHYNPGDSIYLFGFSRGAATIRAFNGFVDACGLIDGRDSGNKELHRDVGIAMKAYEDSSNRSTILSDIKRYTEVPEITFIGVWDTVSALGFPERTDITGIGTKLFHHIFKASAFLINKISPYNFYQYGLTSNVRNAYQALAIDDERTAFWPILWDESSKNAENLEIEQVWFAGMHSNVGGGYERAGLANVSFIWMLDKVKGLKFKDGVIKTARAEANVNGRMYDSRQGAGSYYRYHPRNITELCAENNVKVKIHESVQDRLLLRTANYAPNLIPENFQVVDNQGKSKPSPIVHTGHWKLFNQHINFWIKFRKWLYPFLLELTAGIIGLAIYFWNCPPIIDFGARTGITKNIIDVLEYVTPTMFDGLIEVAIVQNPLYTIAVLVIVGGYFIIRSYARKKTTYYAECLRKLIINSPQGHPEF
jgi:uncharacterized protein (DUF2235 family)